MTVYNSNTDELYDLKTKGCVIYTREKHPAEYGFDPGMHVVLPYDIDQGIKSSLTSIEYEFQPELTIIDLFQIDNLIILRDGQDFDENATLCTDFKGTHFNYIYTNEPFDLNFLDYMRNLKILHISNYNQADILDVRNLENLQFISFPTNQITDLSPISNLKNLKGADFNGNKIEDVSPLMEIDSLTYLQLNGNNIADLSPFDGNLSQLDILMLSDNKISDISPLAGLRALRVLALNNNEITDLSPLLELEKLKNVEIDEWQAEQSQSAYNELLEKGVHVGVTIFE
jgi:Leucine-rich repeat (LRR) protein